MVGTVKATHKKFEKNLRLLEFQIIKEIGHELKFYINHEWTCKKSNFLDGIPISDGRVILKFTNRHVFFKTRPTELINTLGTRDLLLILTILEA